jgi:hypothetical protein
VVLPETSLMGLLSAFQAAKATKKILQSKQSGKNSM